MILAEDGGRGGVIPTFSFHHHELKKKRGPRRKKAGVSGLISSRREGEEGALSVFIHTAG